MQDTDLWLARGAQHQSLLSNKRNGCCCRAVYLSDTVLSDLFVMHVEAIDVVGNCCLPQGGGTGGCAGISTACANFKVCTGIVHRSISAQSASIPAPPPLALPAITQFTVLMVPGQQH